MAITIQEIQKQWGVSRATVYKHIKAGKLSRLADGLVDISEVLRVYGEPSKNTQSGYTAIAVDTQETKLLLDRISRSKRIFYDLLPKKDIFHFSQLAI